MASAFAWLNSLIRSFSQVFPRLVNVRATHRGVVFGAKGGIRVLEPGLRIYWPVASQVRLMSVITRSWEVNRTVVGEHLNTDWTVPVPYSISASAVIHVRVSDVEKVLEVFSIPAAVDTVAKGALCFHWEGENDETYRAAVKATVTERLGRWGIEVLSFQVIDVYRNVNIGGMRDLYGETDSDHSGDTGVIQY